MASRLITVFLLASAFFGSPIQAFPKLRGDHKARGYRQEDLLPGPGAGHAGCDFSRTCKGISYSSGVLKADCVVPMRRPRPGQDSALVESSIDLNYYFANKDGRIEPAKSPPGNFLDSCLDVAMEHGGLSATCVKGDGKTQAPARLHLDRYIGNDKGKLVICK